MNHRLLLAAAAGAVLGASALAAAPALAATRSPFGFGVVKAAPKDGGGEPSLAIAADGTEYISYPGRHVNVYVSHDAGRSWASGTPPEAPSGDTSVNVDTSGALYVSNLREPDADPNSLQVDMFKSFDQGRTWPIKAQSTLEPSNSSGQPFLVDRQWFDAVIPPGKTTNQAHVFVEYHDFVPGLVWVETSTDGGSHFGPPVNVINDPVALADSYCNTIPGGVKVVPYGRNPAGVAYQHPGRVYAVWLAADPANAATGCNETQMAAFHAVWMAYSDDQGATWTDRLVFDGGPLHDGSEIFADLTLDDQGNPYVAFAMNLQQQFDVFATGSLDGGATFVRPVKIDTDTGTHYFPAIAAGRPGHIVVAYLETPDVIPTSPNGKPLPGGDKNSDWRLAAGESFDLFAARPAVVNQVITPTPLHHGDICTLGIFCVFPDSNRDLLDFIDAQIDPRGMAHIAFTGDYGQYEGIYAANQTAGPSFGPPGH